MTTKEKIKLLIRSAAEGLYEGLMYSILMYVIFNFGLLISIYICKCIN